MACTPVPSVPLPSLPPGISIGVSIPSPSFDAALCCKLLGFSPSVPPIGLGVPLNPAIQVAIAGALQGLQNYFSQLAIRCPRE